MDNLDNLFNAESTMRKAGSTYFSGDAFVEDMKKGELIDGFRLSEGAFQEIVGEICADKEFAKTINDNSVLIVIKADKQMELGGILELAETVANGR
jgi:hypothetical protein